MKAILWVSRHDMTDEQKKDFIRIYGNDISVDKLDKTVNDINEILEKICDVYAVVLPTELMCELRNKTDKEIIYPVSERIPTENTVFNPASGRYEREYIFRHLCWKRILKADIITEIL